MEGLNDTVEMEERLSSCSDANSESHGVNNENKSIGTDSKMKMDLRLRKQQKDDSNAAAKELDQSQKPNENYSPLLEKKVSKHIEESLNTEQNTDQHSKMKQLTLNFNIDMELLGGVEAADDNIPSGASTFLQQPVVNSHSFESVVSKYSQGFPVSEQAGDSYHDNDVIHTTNLSNASNDEGIDTSMKSYDSYFSREILIQDSDHLLKKSILRNSSSQQAQHMDKDLRVRFLSCDSKESENQPDERLSDHDANDVLNPNDNDKVIIEKLCDHLLKLSKEQHDQAKLLENLKLENRRLEQQMKQEKVIQEANLALWMKRCSRLAARESMLEKQLEANANAKKEEPITPSGQQLDPEGGVIDDVAEDIYMNKLKQLNAHILMLNTEIDHWKAMYERLNDQFEIFLHSRGEDFLYSRGEEAHDELLYSKEVIKVMLSKCKKLTYALAKKEKELQRHKKHNKVTRTKDKPTIDVVTSEAIKMSLCDMKQVSGSRNSFQKMFMSEVSKKNQSTKQPNRINNNRGSNTSHPINPIQAAYPSILKKRNRSTSLDSRRVSTPNLTGISTSNTSTHEALKRSASWDGKNKSTLQVRYSSSSSESSASGVSTDSPSSGSYSLYGISSSDSSSSDSSASEKVKADKQRAANSMASAGTVESFNSKHDNFDVSNSSLNSLNSLTCSVYHMPYKGKRPDVNGLYSGHIDIESRLPNGFGELKCTNGDVLRGNWKMGVL
eukprot:scaffold12387_cov63-Cyclotella_meneghiniana.AAC.3